MPSVKYDFTPITKSDWAEFNDHEIAEQMSCSVWTVRHYRRMHHKPKGPRKEGSGRKAVVDMSKFRIAFSNAWNAEALGCTVQRAGQIRRKLLGEAPVKRTSTEDWC